MFIDSVIIVSIVVSCLVFFLLVAIFSAVFHRKLGNKKRDKNEEDDALSETKRLTPVPLDESVIEYTTSSVQPVSKFPVDGYPHNQEPNLEEEEEEEEDSAEEIPVEPEVIPTLTILLRYDRQRNYLLLKLLNLFDLPLRRDKTEVNSFLEIRLLPHFGQNPIQTDVYTNSSSPKLEETFEFEVDREELSFQKIEFVVMDAREYSNRSIGYALLKIDTLNITDLMAEKEVNTVVTIGKARMQKTSSQISLNSSHDSGEEMLFTTSMAEGINLTEGDQPRKTKATVRLAKDWEYVAGMEPMILTSMQYDKESEKLVLAIIKVANLKVLPNNKMPDPYVKVRIYVRNKLKLKKKTAVMKQEFNPVYNQKLEFPLLGKDLDNVKLVLAVKNHVPSRGGSIRGKPSSMHEVVFGESSSGSCLEHWKAAITSTKPVAKWHVLS